MYVCMYVCITSTLAHTKAAFADLKDGLVAYYPFNGNANDESGNGNNGTVYGATLTTDRFGNINKAYSFDGSNDYISLPSSTTLDNLQESNYSISAWFKPNSTPAVYDETKDYAYGIVMKPGRHAGIRYGTMEGINNKFILEHWLGDSDDDTRFAVSSNTYSPGQFYHIVGILNKTDGITNIYINGQLGGQNNYTAGSNTREYGITKWNIGIGNSSASRDNARYAAYGVIDEVRFYNHALSESEIQELYKEGTTPTKPTATTSPATNVASNSVTLNGKVNANGGTTTAWFEYGMTSGTYSNTTSSKTASGWSDTTISTDVSGLSSGTMYYYRAVAQNSEGVAYGSETSFTTLAPPTVVTGDATNITMISATLNGTVNAKGTSTTAWFEYGSASGAYSNTTAQKSVSGSGDTPVSVYVSGLAAGKTYYYRLVAENNAGTAYGSEKSFITSSATAPTPVPTPGTTPTPAALPTPGITPSPAMSPTPVATPIPTPSPSGTGVVFGYVNDEDDNPLRGVTVKITGNGYSKDITTDGDGYYEFDDVPDGDYTITYTKTGYVAQTAETTVADGDKVGLDTVVMQAVQKGSIYGYVTDIRGDPIETVRLTLNGVGIKVKKTASSDREGFYEFENMDAGTYRLVATKRFYKTVQQTVKLEEGEDKENPIEMKRTTKRALMECVQE